MNIKQLQKICHQIAVEKGFWGDVCICKSPNTIAGLKGFVLPFCRKCFKTTDKNRNNGEMIALMHSELSEALEELRKKDCNMRLVGEELADCVIRVMDFCGARGIDLEEEILKKIKKNRKRPFKHGKKF